MEGGEVKGVQTGGGCSSAPIARAAHLFCALSKHVSLTEPDSK